MYVTGRIKDVIVTGAGKNVYPADLEAIYQSIPAIKEICVLGVKSGLTEDIHAVLTSKADPPETRAQAEVKKEIQREIQRFGKELPSYHRLQHIHVWLEPLPRNDSGGFCREAVRRRLLEELQQDRPLSAQASQTRPGQGKSQEEDLFRELSRLSGIPSEEIREDSHLYSDLGLDSLMTIQLLLFAESHFGVTVSDQVAPTLQTAGQLLEQIRFQTPVADKARAKKRRIHSARPYNERSATDRWLLGSSHRVLKLLYQKYFRLKVYNQEHLPAAGPFIIAANHSSHLDGGAMISAVSEALGPQAAQKMHILGARDYFFDTPLKSWFFSTFLNLVPVEREETSLAGLRMVKSILSGGESVLIFPEGTRSRTGQLQEFKPGVGLIAQELGVPVIPAYIQGTHRAMPVGKALPRRCGIEVFFAPAIQVESASPDGPGGATNDERYRQLAAAVRAGIAGLARGSDTRAARR